MSKTDGGAARPALAGPWRYATIGAAVFAIELALMAALAGPWAGLPGWLAALIDAALLTAATAALMWSLVVRRIRADLSSERELARVVLETASEGIVTIDDAGVIRGFNRAAEQVFGYSAAEALGRNISILMPPAEATQHDAHIARYRATGEKRVVNTTRQVDARHKSGRLFPVEMSMSEVRAGERLLFTAIIRDVTERRKLENKVLHMAHYDALTGLPNRTLFFDRLNQAASLARRRQERLGLLYLDLDGFKAINDTHGHGAGDFLLRAIAERLRRRIRDSDTVARLGGDEFAFVLPGIGDRSHAEAVAADIRTACDKPVYLEDVPLRVGASVGVAILPDDTQFIEELVQIADQGMYRAKRAARGKAELPDRAAS
jgi:diguanylate cyclase (GGDEF)-like protein/PAS domain S-box-containing protein